MSLYDELDLDSVDESATGEYELMPVGNYSFIVEEVERKDAASGLGSYLKVTCAVTNNEAYEGRKVWCNFNIHHQNKKAESIGRAQLKQLLVATGMDGSEDEEALVGKEFIGKLGVQKGTNGYSDSNVIKKFSALASQTATPKISPETQETAY